MVERGQEAQCVALGSTGDYSNQIDVDRRTEVRVLRLREQW